MNWRATLSVSEEDSEPYTQYSHNVQNTPESDNCAYIADIALRNPMGQRSELRPADASAHNTHNVQKSSDPGNCAYIADSALRDPLEDRSRLLEALAPACKGLSITPLEVRDSLSSVDIVEWRSGIVSDDVLTAYTKALAQRRLMDQGKRPAHYTERATCRHCGPVWLWFAGEVLCCPWCWNRSSDMPIPRSHPICCGDCIHFTRIDHPHLGHCAKGEPEAAAGLWDTSRRGCQRYLMKQEPRTDG